MQKREPVIIAPDYTDDELYEWMRQKINAAQDRSVAGKCGTHVVGVRNKAA